MAWASDMPERRVDAFRLARGRPLMVGVLLSLIAGASLALAAHDAERLRASGELAWLQIAGLLVLAAALGAFWLAWRRPVLLRVGPEGIHVTLGYRRPLPWNDIRTIDHTGWRTGIFHKVSVLKVEPAPDAELCYRGPRLPRAIERWYARRVGVLVPLQYIDADAETVIASVERFHPVERTT